MEEKFKGLVVSAINYGENDKILTVFTLEHGTLTVKIKGVKKAGAKLKFASEPFCFAEFVVVKKADKMTVKSASLIDSFYPIRENIERFFAGGTILEFIRKFNKENMESGDLFMLTLKSLESLAYGDENPKSVCVKFLISALKFSGFGLNFIGCAECETMPKGRVFFDYSTGAFYCENCKEDGFREINFLTFLALQKADSGEVLLGEESDFSLRLINFYLINKAEERLKSLDELIKL